jgi:RNase P subunit RPR2
MIAELIQSYRGVLCARCREPIAVCGRVASLHQELEHSEAKSPQMFVARCRGCGHESVYALSDVRVFEGEPVTRRARTRSVCA